MNNCIFCNLDKERIISETEHFIIIKDNFPVSPGHTLIISKNHHDNFFSLSIDEISSLNSVIFKAKELIEPEYKPDGYNIGINCGKSAGQTVMHFHCHLIPRYIGDVKNPRGGIRHVIPHKANY